MYENESLHLRKITTALMSIMIAWDLYEEWIFGDHLHHTSTTHSFLSLSRSTPPCGPPSPQKKKKNKKKINKIFIGQKQNRK